MSLWRPPPIPVDSFPPASWKTGCLPVRMSPPLTSAPSASAKWAHGSCINQQHGDPRFSPDAPPPVVWLPEPCHYAGALSQSPLNKYETAPLCVTVFYIQQGSRESRGNLFSPICELKRWAGLVGGESREWGCKPLQLFVSHSHPRCMIPVANVYTYLCVSKSQDVTLIY